MSFNHRGHAKNLKFSGLLIISLLGTATGGYFVVRMIQLNFAQRLILVCVGKKHCHGRVEALERLVKAQKSLKSYNLDSANLDSANLANADFDGANLANADLTNADLNNAKLVNADLTSAYLVSAYLVSANLDSADLTNAKLVNADLTSTKLVNAKLVNADLTSARLDSVKFINADLTSANLASANLASANLSNANLASANLTSANLIGVHNLTPPQLKSACHWEKAIYKIVWDEDKWKWIVDGKANQRFINELQQDKTSNAKETVDCNRWD